MSRPATCSPSRCWWAALGCAGLMLVGGCTGGATASGEPTEPAGATAAGECGPTTATVTATDVTPVPDPPTPALPVTVESADGERVTVTDASRILPVNLYGSIAEIVFSLGLGDRVVGRDTATTFPAAAHLPLVTPAGHDLSAEGVLALDPTVVLVDASIGPPEVLDQLRRSGVPVVFIDDEQTLPAVSVHIRQIAAALGVPGAGEELVERVETQIAQARRSAPDGERPLRIAFLYVRGSAGVYLIGGAGAGSDAIGQVPVSAAEVVGSLLHRLGLEAGPLPAAPQGENALWQVRFPRVCLALLVGACLGCGGALMQGMFGNPLAEPGVVGVSAGAAVGAAAALVAGVAFAGGVAAAAFAGGLVATFTVYAMARSGGRTEVVTLVLTGIAINAVAGAAIGLLMFLTDADGVRAIAFWNLGSLAPASWVGVATVAPCAAAGLAVAMRYAGRLDLLALGERPARHLGVDVERMRLVLIAITALLTAAAVAFCGVIGFVGLVVPHLVRMAAGPGHRVLVPASALGGAIVVVTGDLAARTLIPYQELPLGVLTAVVGGPFFFWLLRRTRARAGGWG